MNVPESPNHLVPVSHKLAFVFPGQGSQFVGMGKDLYENYEEAKIVFQEASAVLEYDVADMCFNGPKDELNKTYRTQPCLLTASFAVFKVLSHKGVSPFCVAGHSLGEYTAVAAAGVISFRDAVKIAEKRGVFMQEAVPEGKGLMAAVLGIERETLDRICINVKSGYVSPANYNCPGQIVISGEKKAVEEAMKMAEDSGAKRALPLAVSVPSHCSLMNSAAEKLSELLYSIKLAAPQIPVVNNADALFLNNTSAIKNSLVRQINSPLLWEDSVNQMIEKGVDTFIEVGPKKVLSGLVKRINTGVKIYNVEDSKSLDETLSAIS